MEMERTRDRLRLRFSRPSSKNDPECAVVGGVIAHNLGHNCWKAGFIGGQMFQVYSKVIQIYIHTHTHPFSGCFHCTLLQDIDIVSCAIQ